MYQINVAVPGFLISGPVLEGVQQIELPLQCTAEEVATPSLTVIKEEEVVEIFESEDKFKVFSHHQFPEAPAEDFSHPPPAQVSCTQKASSIPNVMMLQCRTRTSLHELMESHARGNMSKKAVQSSLKPLSFLLRRPRNLRLLIKRGSETKRTKR